MNQREIKFRAYDTEGNEYVNSEPLGKMWYENEFINHFKVSGIPYNTKGKRWKIMQYTGLKDIDGSEIYEGDILEANGIKSVKTGDFSNARKYVSSIIKDTYEQIKGRFLFKIVWGESFLQWNIYPIEYGTQINADVSKREYKIIGNIYENPELCEKI